MTDKNKKRKGTETQGIHFSEKKRKLSPKTNSSLPERLVDKAGCVASISKVTKSQKKRKFKQKNKLKNENKVLVHPMDSTLTHVNHNKLNAGNVESSKLKAHATSDIIDTDSNDSTKKLKKKRKKLHKKNDKKIISTKIIKDNVHNKNSNQSVGLTHKGKWKKLRHKKSSKSENVESGDINQTVGVTKQTVDIAKQTVGVAKQKVDIAKQTVGVAKQKGSREKLQLDMPKGPADFDSNWKELLKTLEKPATKKQTKQFINRHRKKPEESKQQQATPESEIWFDDVDDILLGKPASQSPQALPSNAKDKHKPNPLVKPESFQGVTKVIAMDCEMVGVGSDGKDSVLARASLVNQFGQCIYDKYVKPSEAVTDYRTHVSGIRPEHLVKGEEFSTVCREISDMIKGRTLVGHAIHNDLKVLFLDHPHKQIRDTQRYKPFRQIFEGRNPGLKKLTEKVLGVKVQEGQHDSVQDAQAAMRLYTMHRQAWEKSIREKCKKPKKISSVVQMNVDT